MAVENISTNLYRIRKAKNLSMQELADKCDLSRVAYSAIENGKSQPKSSTLIGLASKLDVDIKDLLAGSPEFKSLRFRTNKTMTKQQKNIREQIIYDVARWLKDYNELEEISGLSQLSIPSVSDNDPEKASEEFRKHLGLDNKEPVEDILGLLSKQGVKFYLAPFTLKNFFGFSIARDDGGPAVIVNISDSITIERRIFTSAHELGHILLHSNSFKQHELDEIDQEEHEADLFAGFFLLPDEGFKREWDECKGLNWYDAVLHIKRKYRVSYKTVLHRLIVKNELNASDVYIKFNRLMAQKYNVSLKGNIEPLSFNDDSTEPDSLSNNDFVEDKLHKLVRSAYEQEKISLSRAAEILRMSMREMIELNNGWKDYH
ncbi:MAG: ImmA/IrrE family metallo-endopeptidase [Spirochaetia bacterium]|jgi:Zn-dependent peptidase ImmA (M78 family)/DNA-binding XRE family transcriptional regulator|nr:ImmA/IrrE family metallo-endopeptidase [Spirochaetia bacterium]